MKKKNERNAGAKPKFPNTEVKTVRISRVVPLDDHDDIKKKTNDFISKLQSEALTKCSEEAIK